MSSRRDSQKLIWQSAADSSDSSLIYSICSCFFFPLPFFLLLHFLLLSWHQACALRRALCQEHNLLQSGRLERWRGVERGGGGEEWGETVIFSSGPEGSPSLYKALWAAQELHSSYLLQEHGQQAAAAGAAAAGWSSHKGILQLSLSLSLSIQAAGYQLRKDKRWVSQMRHYTHLFLECVECCVCVILPKIKTLNCAPGGKGYTSGWGIECECKWSLIFYFEKSVLCY